MAATFYNRLHGFRLTLQSYGYDLRLASARVSGGASVPVMVRFPTPLIGDQSLVVLPDVHLGAGDEGDVFYCGSAENPRRLAAVLRTMRDYTRANAPTTLLQLGDWYDVWRAIGKDATSSQYSRIDSVPAYQEILGLDVGIELAHAYGNHDASFTHALPDRRVADRDRFRFGWSLLGSRGKVFALHGHQADDIAGQPNAPGDQRAVWLGTLAADYLSSEFRNLEEYMDKQGNLAGAEAWLLSLVGLNREDPQATGRPRQDAPSDGQPWGADFVKREAMARLVKIAQAAADRLYTDAEPLSLLVVGHSHAPCVGWTPHPTTGKPVVVIDCGSWVYGAAQVMFAAGSIAAVYDVVRMGAG